MAQVTCFLVVLIFVVAAIAITHPWVWAILAAGIAVGIIAYMSRTRKAQIASIGAFKEQAYRLQELADEITKGANTEDATFALKNGEVVLGRSDGFGLLEWVSTGSTYQGGSQGVSIRVTRGVSYRVGSSRGQLVKNPPALKTLDVGTVTYTSDRVIFSGMQETRQWDVAKVLDLNVTDNGQTVMISASNRQKPSGLQGTSFSLVGPGFMVRAALTLHNAGAKAAADELRSSAQDLLDVAEATRIKLRQPADSA